MAQWVLTTEAAPRANRVLDVLEGVAAGGGARSGGLVARQQDRLAADGAQVRDRTGVLTHVLWALLGVGLAVAAALVGVVSGIFSRASGIAMTASIGWTEIGLALTLAAVGAVLSILPAALLYRRPVVEALRSA